MLKSAGILLAIISLLLTVYSIAASDHVKDLQTNAIQRGKADWGHWGPSPDKYSSWTTHTNRLVPIYTYGIGLEKFTGEASLYRQAGAIDQLYGRPVEATHNPTAEYCDQTDIYRLQQAAMEAGKKHVILFIFDGLDWQTLQAAAVYQAATVGYTQGRGTGLFLQGYHTQPDACRSDFGYCVTSPHNHGTSFDVNAQIISNSGGSVRGGYNADAAGATPWQRGTQPRYLQGLGPEIFHAVTDSAASATSLTAGIKTYNDAINIDPAGAQVSTVAHDCQERGMSIGVVTSVPISHATPACGYAHNVSRDDYQDLTRDMIGRPSVSHRVTPLSGMDVLIGGGWGENREQDADQGQNYEPGNRYLAASDLQAIDAVQGGRYRVVQRTAGVEGRKGLETAAADARDRGLRLFGFFGIPTGHLPYRTADGGFDPTVGVTGKAEVYSPADIAENPTLADMSRAALHVLEANDKGFWLMIEAGDVDWANHDNNIDNSIGAVLSGDDAFRAVAEWVDAKNAWDETAVILTADHGHYLVLEQPQALVEPASRAAE